MCSKMLVSVDGGETSAAGLNEAIKRAKDQSSQLCIILTRRLGCSFTR